MHCRTLFARTLPTSAHALFLMCNRAHVEGAPFGEEEKKKKTLTSVFVNCLLSLCVRRSQFNVNVFKCLQQRCI